MRILTSTLLSVSLVASSCSMSNNKIIGKWDCKKADESAKITREFLQEGTAIYTFESKPKTTNLSDGTSFTPDPLIIKDVSTWKKLDENRISMTNKSDTFIKEYKIENDQLKLKSDKNDGTWQSCDRVK